MQTIKIIHNDTTSVIAEKNRVVPLLPGTLLRMARSDWRMVSSQRSIVTHQRSDGSQFLSPATVQVFVRQPKKDKQC